jgi:hypothetical protein
MPELNNLSSEKDPQLSFLTAKLRWRSMPQMSEENAERKLIIEMVDLVVVFGCSKTRSVLANSTAEKEGHVIVESSITIYD